MLHLTWFEFFVRVIPEEFFTVLLVHALAKQKVDKKRYILASLLYAVLVFAVRELPISYGIHTIINVIILIAVSYYINKINLTASIRSGIITLIFLYICELINMYFIQYILHLDVTKMYTDIYIKTIYSLPSLILLAIIAILLYYLLAIRKRDKNV